MNTTIIDHLFKLLVVFTIAIAFCGNARALDTSAEGLIKSCRLTVESRGKIIYDPNDAMASGFCIGIITGMINSKFDGCGGGVPGWTIKGFVVALEDARTNLKQANNWWPKNPAGWIANEAFKSVPLEKNLSGKLCPTDNTFVFYDLLERYR